MKYFFILISLTFIMSCGPSKEDRAQQQLNEGIKMLYKARYNDALRHFEKALELNPLLTEALVNKARVYVNQNKLIEAIEVIDAALVIDPKNGEAYNTRAQALFYMGDKMGSCVDWKKADELGVPNLDNKIRNCP